MAPVALPLSRADQRALESRRSELSSQLTSADSRRRRLLNEMQDATGIERTGMEGRLAVLDERILQLERDIAQNGRLLAQAAMGTSTGQASRTPFSDLSNGQITGLSVVFMIFVLAPIAFAFARLLLRRSVAPARPPKLDDSARRLEHLEGAVDTIAIEIERISEGQRFMTRILTDGRAPSIGAGEAPAEPIRSRAKESVPASRDED